MQCDYSEDKWDGYIPASVPLFLGRLDRNCLQGKETYSEITGSKSTISGKTSGFSTFRVPTCKVDHFSAATEGSSPSLHSILKRKKILS